MYGFFTNPDPFAFVVGSVRASFLWERHPVFLPQFV